MNNYEITATPLRIAIPHENGRLHGHFGGCREFAIVEADSETKTVRATRTVPGPPHQPGLFPRWLREQGVSVVVADGIGRRALDMFAQHGIVVRTGVPGTSVEATVAAYLSGQLNASPAGGEHHDHHHDDEHEHGHHHQPHGQTGQSQPAR